MLELPGLTLTRPWALVALLGLAALYRWHRQARLTGGRAFTAFFLLGRRDGERGDRGRLRAPGLFAARCGALIAATLALCGPRLAAQRVIIAAAPVEAGDEVVIRAGRPPTVESGADWAAVAAPDWSAALTLARQVAPGGQITFAPAPPRVIRAAGVALDGDAVVVTAAVAGGRAPRISAQRIGAAMTERAGDWLYRGRLPPGPARVEVGGVAWPVCIPPSTPLPVADRGWPPAVEALLEVLPDVERAPPEAAVWRPGPAPPRDMHPAPFAPDVVFFEFAADADRAAAPLWFADALPPPGAIARRWRPLVDPGDAVLFAGDAVVVDRGRGLAGAGRRFGFDPADTDLPATAGWPVLFVDALAHDRAARGRCWTHPAGRPLAVRSDVPLRATDAFHRSAVYAPEGGVIRLPAPDTAGFVRLEAPDGRAAHVAIVPGEADDGPAAAPPSAPGEGRAVAAPLVVVGLGCLLISALLGARDRWSLAALLAGGSALWGGALPGGPRPVAVMVDTSASMPPEETRSAAAAVVRALGERPHRRLMSAAAPWDAPGDLGPFDLTARDPLAALRAAPPAAMGEGALILITDGRDPGLPRDFGVPVIAVPVQAARPDARVVHASAVRLGEQVFVRATVEADRAGPATVTLGDAAPVGVRLRPGRPQSVQAVLPAPPPRRALDRPPVIAARVSLADDRQPLNDLWPTPIAGERPPEAVVVGRGAAGWAAAAGLEVLAVPAGALAESGARLAQARAMFVHDQPAATLGPATAGRLRRWIEAGGVLVLSGRAAAFGPGGWRGTPLDALSPLTADPRPPGSGRLAVALVLDRSGSIAEEAGGPGLDALGRLAGSVAAGLRPDDQLAVLAFGGAVETLLPPTPVARVAEVPTPAIARGGTALGPALDRARALLARAPAEVRIAVVVGDGRVADAEGAAAAAEELSAADVRLMFALTGPDPDRATAARLVEAGGGALIPAGAGLDVSVSSAVLDVSGDGPAQGGPVTAEAGWPGRVGGLPPAVEARVRVGARPAARVLARVAGDPLLAEWSVGHGRVIALATDRWELSAEQWSSLLAPAAAPRPGDVQIAVEGDALVYRGPPAEPPPVGPLRVRSAAGITSIRWSPTGPGEARAPLPEGPVELLEVSTATARGALVAPVVRPPPAELRQTGLDRAALALQAALSGGVVVPPEGVPAALDGLASGRGLPWRPLGLALGLALLLIGAWRWSTGAGLSRG